MSEDTRKLLKLVATGNEQAFASLYAQFCDRVFNTALSYLQQNEEAEEIAQDVFVEIHRSAAKFKGNASVSTWIYRITVNKCLDRIRQRKNKRSLGRIISIFGEPNDPARPIPDFHHPGIALENKESAARLFREIDQLPENQKTAFILSYVEELPRQEVANVMGSSLKAIESLLQRAKSNLRERLKK